MYLNKFFVYRVYPKTDWTYLYNPIDNIELAEVVVAIPNMSRRTIHSVYESDTISNSDYAHKQTNTESSFTSAEHYKPRQLFNNNYYDKYEECQKITTYISSCWLRTKRTIFSIYRTIFSFFYYMFEFMSRIMHFVIWLLKKVIFRQKSSKITLLILLPLLFLGGKTLFIICLFILIHLNEIYWLFLFRHIFEINLGTVHFSLHEIYFNIFYPILSYCSQVIIIYI